MTGLQYSNTVQASTRDAIAYDKPTVSKQKQTLYYYNMLFFTYTVSQKGLNFETV